ncbi:MAG: MdtA/MuxA family multidrug efflux RND transporter periplasmic adaptor subunit [Stellaceae bacterium]
MTQPPTPPETPPLATRRRRFRALLVIVVVILALAAAWAWWPRSPTTGTNSAAVAAGGRGRFAMAGPQPVGVASVTRGNIPVTVNALGTVTPLATVTVRTQINGQLVKIGFTEGQMVKKGDFLAEIDPRPYEIALEQAKAQQARDQAILKGAEGDLARYQRLARQNSIAKQQADDQAALVQQYQGTVALDQAQIDSAKLNLSYCHITSPVTGMVGLRQVDVGNYVTTNDTNGLVVVTQLQPMAVVFPVPEGDLPAIRSRLDAGAKMPVAAYGPELTTKLATGTLYAIDSQIDPTTGTIRLKAQFTNSNDALFPQQFVNAQLLINTLSNVVVAPIAAIQHGAPGTFVFKVVPGDKVAMTTVKVGPSAGQNVEILAGLEPGDRVVIDGTDRLRNGSKIQIPGAKPVSGAVSSRHLPVRAGAGLRTDP